MDLPVSELIVLEDENKRHMFWSPLRGLLMHLLEVFQPRCPHMFYGIYVQMHHRTPAGI
jgi:hypothetical protein